MTSKSSFDIQREAAAKEGRAKAMEPIDKTNYIHMVLEDIVGWKSRKRTSFRKNRLFLEWEAYYGAGGFCINLVVDDLDFKYDSVLAFLLPRCVHDDIETLNIIGKILLGFFQGSMDDESVLKWGDGTSRLDSYLRKKEDESIEDQLKLKIFRETLQKDTELFGGDTLTGLNADGLAVFRPEIDTWNLRIHGSITKIVFFIKGDCHSIPFPFPLINDMGMLDLIVALISKIKECYIEV